MTRRFEGRRAIVTGASRGIGAGIATRLAAEGADVALVARTLERHERLSGSLQETADEVERLGSKAAIVVADLTDEDDRARVLPEARDALGGSIDILVNNAAAAMYADLVDFPLRRRRVLFEANVHAPLDLAQAAAPDMIAAGRGWIVNLSSGSARMWDGPPFELGVTGSSITVYGASKAALNRITNGLGAEFYGTGVRVNTIEPRAAVMSEGAEALLGDSLSAGQIESLEAMVEATVALCDCGPEVTGSTLVSLDLLDAWGLDVRNLDGTAR